MRVAVVDSQGRVVPRSKNHLKFFCNRAC
ncbi:MAG: hypothetical protein ACLVL2_08210 [Bacteroides cellulosilyticus]